MDNADTPLLGQGDCHVGLGDRVHGGADDGDVQADLAGQPGSGIDLGGEHGTACRYQKHVIEG